MTQEFEAALTAAVGEFIRQVRLGNSNPSMNSILKKNGIRSYTRAKQLVERMVQANILYQGDNGYRLKQINVDSKVVMPILLRREYHHKSEKSQKSIADYSAAELVAELRSRGYAVKATKEIVTIEEL